MSRQYRLHRYVCIKHTHCTLYIMHMHSVACKIKALHSDDGAPRVLVTSVAAHGAGNRHVLAAGAGVLRDVAGDTCPR